MKKTIFVLIAVTLLASCTGNRQTVTTVQTFDEYCSPFDEEVLSAKLKAIRHVVFDMDGTIYLDGNLFPYTMGVLDSLTAHGIGYSFLTNNPSKNIGDYLDRLHNLGINVTADNMYSPVAATVSYLHAKLPEAKNLFLLGTPSMVAQFEQAGYRSTEDSADDRPDALVVAFDMTLTYDRLCRAAWWASQGVPFIATNPDLVCPTSKPTVLVDCGSITKCIEEATGRKADVVIGKPSAEMLTPVLEHNSLSNTQVAMVGDRIYTDVAMAHNAGALGVLVLSGETTLETALSNDPQPDVTAATIEVFCRKLIEAQSK